MYNEKTYVKPATHSIAQVDLLFCTIGIERGWQTLEHKQSAVKKMQMAFILSSSETWKSITGFCSARIANRLPQRIMWVCLDGAEQFAFLLGCFKQRIIILWCFKSLWLRPKTRSHQSRPQVASGWANAFPVLGKKCNWQWNFKSSDDLARSNSRLAELEHVRSAAAGSLLLEGSELGGTSRLLPNDLGRSQKIQEAQIVNTRVEPCLFISMSISYLTLTFDQTSERQLTMCGSFCWIWQTQCQLRNMIGNMQGKTCGT